MKAMVQPALITVEGAKLNLSMSSQYKDIGTETNQLLNKLKNLPNIICYYLFSNAQQLVFVEEQDSWRALLEN